MPVHGINYKEVLGLDQEKIIEGIKKGDYNILKDIYKNNFDSVRNYVLKNRGNTEDAKDIFQEAMVIVYNKANSGTLTLKCNFNTFIFSVCRHLWLKKLRKNKFYNEVNEDYMSVVELPVVMDFEAEYMLNQKYRLYRKHYNYLEKECKKLLRLFVEGFSYKEITKRMGFNDDVYARKRKHRCKKLLKRSIINDPKYKEIIDEEY